jgi:hypothetical protein
MFSCEENELKSFDGLDVRVKPPIFIYEGYYHSMVTPKNVFSRNPNPLIGIDFMKPPAHEFLRAFFESFRRINGDLFNRLRNRLNISALTRRSSEFDVCFQLASWIQKGYLFGDLSIQVHYGMGNDKTFPRAWHADAENSLLHLALTLRGFRVLHSRQAITATDILAIENLEPQRPGDVYLSSSALMLHAPQFFNSSYDERVIAIHARILYTTEELQLFRKGKTNSGWQALTTILSEELASAHIFVPTHEDIELVKLEIIAGE